MTTEWIKQYRRDAEAQGKQFSDSLIHRAVQDGFVRADDTALLALQVEHMMTETFETDYAPALALQIFPVDDTRHAGETVTYRQVTKVGTARELSHYGEDIPTADVSAHKFVQNVGASAIGYKIDIQSLRGAAMAGVPLEAEKQDASQLAINQWLDTLCTTGSTLFNIAGTINHASIPLVAAVTGTWATATGAQMFGDVSALLSGVYNQTLQTQEADTLLTGTVQFGQLDTLVANTNMTAKQMILANTKIARIQPWWALDLADAGGTGPRMMAFRANTGVIRATLPQPFELTAPQLQGLVYTTIAHCRSAGCIVPKPLGCAYMDGC